MPNNLKVFGRNKATGPKLDSQTLAKQIGKKICKFHRMMCKSTQRAMISSQRGSLFVRLLSIKTRL